MSEPARRHTADTITDDEPTPDRVPLDLLTSDEYDALHTRLWNAETARDAWGAKAGEQQQRAERAEAAIERVRTTATYWARTMNPAADAILAALDEHQEQPG